MGNGNFRPTTELTPLNRSPKDLSQVTTSATPTDMPYLVHIGARGGSGRHLIYAPISGTSPTGQTRRRIFGHNGSNDADSRKDLPLLGYFDMAIHFGDSPPKTILKA